MRAPLRNHKPLARRVSPGLKQLASRDECRFFKYFLCRTGSQLCPAVVPEAGEPFGGPGGSQVVAEVAPLLVDHPFRLGFPAGVVGPGVVEAAIPADVEVLPAMGT